MVSSSRKLKLEWLNKIYKNQCYSHKFTLGILCECHISLRLVTRSLPGEKKGIRNKKRALVPTCNFLLAIWFETSILRSFVQLIKKEKSWKKNLPQFPIFNPKGIWGDGSGVVTTKETSLWRDRKCTSQMFAIVC